MCFVLGAQAIDDITAKNHSLEAQIRSEHLITQIKENLLHHEKMEEKLNAVSKFSSGDYDCSYDVICNFLSDDNFLILPYDQLSDISNEGNLSEQTESDFSSNDDTKSIQRSTENSRRSSEETSKCVQKGLKSLENPNSNQKTTCDVFVIQNIKNSKYNEMRWVNDYPSTCPSVLQMGFAVIKKPRDEKNIHIMIGKKKDCNKIPLQVKLEIINHSKRQAPFARIVDLIDETAEIVVIPYSDITFQSKEKKFLDKNGNVVVECTVAYKDIARLPRKISRNKRFDDDFCDLTFFIITFFFPICFNCIVFMLFVSPSLSFFY